MRDLTDDEKTELQRHCIFCNEPDFILASFPLSLPRQTSQRALGALTDGSFVMDVTTMMRRISEDIEDAVRRYKIAIKDIPEQVKAFEQRVRN